MTDYSKNLDVNYYGIYVKNNHTTEINLDINVTVYQKRIDDCILMVYESEKLVKIVIWRVEERLGSSNLVGWVVNVTVKNRKKVVYHEKTIYDNIMHVPLHVYWILQKGKEDAG